MFFPQIGLATSTGDRSKCFVFQTKLHFTKIECSSAPHVSISATMKWCLRKVWKCGVHRNTSVELLRCNDVALVERTHPSTKPTCKFAPSFFFIRRRLASAIDGFLVPPVSGIICSKAGVSSECHSDSLSPGKSYLRQLSSFLYI